jgi:hypothetical protein
MRKPTGDALTFDLRLLMSIPMASFPKEREIRPMQSIPEYTFLIVHCNVSDRFTDGCMAACS